MNAADDKKPYSPYPVLDKGLLIGVVSIGDVVHAIIAGPELAIKGRANYFGGEFSQKQSRARTTKLVNMHHAPQVTLAVC